MKHAFKVTMTLLACMGSASGALWVDFNSNQAAGGTPLDGDPDNDTSALHNASGYQSYHVAHESVAQLTTPTAGVYNTTFLNTGAASVSVLPGWSNSTAITVRQSIGRTDGQAGSWLGNDVLLLRDWIGTDSRGANNGNWDGTTGTPTYFTLTFNGLAADSYALRTFHHDVENMNSIFSTEISTDGGATFGSITIGRMTNSLAGGTPAENEVLPNTGVNVAGGNPADLSSTQNLSFTATGTDDVVIRFAALGDGQTHKMFFGVNGFQLDQVPEPSTGLLGLLGAFFLFRRRR